MKMVHLIFLLSTASCLLHQVQGFALSRPGQIPSISRASIQSVPVANRVPATSLNADADKDAEIAALEERLRQLKEDESSAVAVDTSSAVETTTAVVEPAEDEPDEDDDSVMFSERWKEAKDDYIQKEDESNMGGIVKVALALVGVIGLAFFSQVPVGEDSLMRYQDVKVSR